MEYMCWGCLGGIKQIVIEHLACVEGIFDWCWRYLLLWVRKISFTRFMFSDVYLGRFRTCLKQNI